MGLNRTIPLLVLFGLLVALDSLAQTPVPESTISGVVRESSGKSLSNVQVTGFHHNAAGGYEPQSTRTDPEGRFRLEDAGPVVFVGAEGYKPEILVTHFEPLEVTLRDSAADEWKIGECPRLKRGYRRFGIGGLQIAVPKTSKLKHTVGDDTWQDQIWVHDEPDSQLILWQGPGNYDAKPLMSSSFPPEKWLLNSSTFSQKAAVHDNAIIAIDASGVEKSGKHWRWIRVEAGIIYYHEAGDDAAISFDKILVSACVGHNN